MARGVMQFAAPAGRRDEPLFLMIDGDVAASLGRILHDELGLAGPVVCIDGLALRELDFVDVGEWLDPPGVVTVVIKSQLFAGNCCHRPGRPANWYYPAKTSRCIQSSNAVGSIEGFANNAYWLAPKTPGRYPAACRSTVRQKGAMP